MDHIGIASDVASVQEPAHVVEQVSGHVPYSPEDAEAVVDHIASQSRVDENERQIYLDAWTSGARHGERDPEAKYYGVKEPIKGEQIQTQ